MPIEKMALKGKPCIHLYLVVPAEKEEEADALFKSHVGFMKKTHAIGAVGTEPRILEYSIAKGKEMNDPMDPSKGETGNIMYYMAETYNAASGVAGHMSIAASKWADGFAKFNEVTGKYANFMAPGLATVCGTMHV